MHVSLLLLVEHPRVSYLSEKASDSGSFPFPGEAVTLPYLQRQLLCVWMILKTLTPVLLKDPERKTVVLFSA